MKISLGNIYNLSILKKLCYIISRVIVQNINYYTYLIIRKPLEFVQRGINGVAESDTWNWCTHNASVQVKALSEIKKRKLGVPCDFTRDSRLFQISEKMWAAILDEMIFAFSQLSNPNIINWPDSENPIWKKFGGTYPDIHLQTKQEARRVKRGLKLYIKHYNSLWD